MNQEEGSPSEVPRLLVLGTGSDVGKTSITPALGAWLRSRGINVVPFKSMSVGPISHVTETGGEIHHHQAQQALAAEVEPITDMNPVMFKTGHTSDIPTLLVDGEERSDLMEADVEARTESLRETIKQAYGRLASQYEFVLMEGCGSPVELNVKERDLANLWLAGMTQSPCVLVVDCERVGVFGSLVGTVSLMTPDERSLLEGFIINKFRGDLDQFQSVIEILEAKTGLSCLGVVPYYELESVAKEQEPADAPGLLEETEAWQQHVVTNLSPTFLSHLESGLG